MDNFFRKFRDGIKKMYARHEHSRNMREWERAVEKRRARVEAGKREDEQVALIKKRTNT